MSLGVRQSRRLHQKRLEASEHLTSLTTLELPVLGVHKPDRERIAQLPAFQQIPNVTYR